MGIMVKELIIRTNKKQLITDSSLFFTGNSGIEKYRFHNIKNMILTITNDEKYVMIENFNNKYRAIHLKTI